MRAPKKVIAYALEHGATQKCIDEGPDNACGSCKTIMMQAFDHFYDNTPPGGVTNSYRGLVRRPRRGWDSSLRCRSSLLYTCCSITGLSCRYVLGLAYCSASSATLSTNVPITVCVTKTKGHPMPRNLPKSQRSNCPITCTCICHDMGGGVAHPGRQCKDVPDEEK